MNENDKVIKKLTAALEEQKKEMGKRPKISFETNGLFPHSDGRLINLNTVSNTKELVNFLSLLLVDGSFKSEAAEMLELEEPGGFWGDYLITDWAIDFLQQSRLIKWRKKKAKFDKVKKRLASLMSEDARTATELEEIKKLLG